MAHRSAVAIGLLAACAGCAGGVPPVPIEHFVAGDFATVRAFYDRELAEGDPASAALFLNGLAQIELLEGDLDAARRHFSVAGSVMGNWNTSGGEAFAAIVGAESSKTWKGDPHEKAMNAYYLGLLYWLRGEPDNARAAFKRGILADGESDEGDAQVDFALLYWLAGRASLAMGLRDDARSFFEEARQAQLFAAEHGGSGEPSNAVLEQPAAGNLIMLIDVGLGPIKRAGGPHGSIAFVEPRAGGPDGADVFIDGESAGSAPSLVDIDYQARTRGGREIEGIRKGKAVFKDMAVVGGAILLGEGFDHGSSEQVAIGAGLLFLSLLTSASADTRTWETLPRSVHVMLADLEPGPHEVRLEFTVGGYRIPELSRTWTVEVPEQGEAIYYFRSLPARRVQDANDMQEQES
jgi:hypothetical protein